MLCDSCKRQCVFFAQIDTEYGEVRDYKLADDALVYVFLCPTCGRVKSIMESC